MRNARLGFMRLAGGGREDSGEARPRNRRFAAQSAMEYLMTYGWAILAISIAIGALYVLGILNPTAFVSQQCLLSAGLSCSVVGMSTNGLITINLVQNM